MNQNTGLLILGGGLSGGLLALYLNKAGFSDFHLVEKESHFGGNHTWSFHKSDLQIADIDFLRGAFHGEWDSQDVHFNSYSRKLNTGYCSITSDRFHEFICNHLPKESYSLESDVQIEGSCAIFSDGRRIEFETLIDATGPDVNDFKPCGYQKFLGLEVELKSPHGLDSPIIMDATVEQKEGFRFIYSLPFTDRTILVEDTRYSRQFEIDENEFEFEVISYIRRNFGEIASILRKEKESLPIPIFSPRQDVKGPIAIGLKSGLFHPVTGYSFSAAVRLAGAATLAYAAGNNIEKEIETFKKNWIQKTKFLYGLNRMLFGAAHDDQRVKIFERFYRLPNGLIHRFYSGNLKSKDQLRILIGKPPVKVHRAIKSLVTSGWTQELN